MKPAQPIPAPGSRQMGSVPATDLEAFQSQLDVLLSLSSRLSQAPQLILETPTEPERLLQRFHGMHELAQQIHGSAPLPASARDQLRDYLTDPEWNDYRQQLRRRVLKAMESNRVYLEQVNLWSRLLHSASKEDPRTRRYDASGSLVTTR